MTLHLSQQQSILAEAGVAQAPGTMRRTEVEVEALLQHPEMMRMMEAAYLTCD